MRSGGLRGLQILRSGVSVRGGFDSHAFPPILLAAVIALAALPVGTVAAPSGDGRAGGPSGAVGGVSAAAGVDSIVPTEARAESTATDTAASSQAAVPAARESLTTGTAPRPRRTLPQPGRFDQPRWVMLRSLLVPGWGQAHNRAWLKAALLAAGDGALRVRFIRDERRLGELNGTATDRLADLESADRSLAAAQAELTAARASGDSVRIAAAEAAVAAANLGRNGASDAYNGAVIAYNTLLDTSINRRWLLGGVVLYALIDAYVDAHFKRFDINLEFDPALPGGTGAPGARLQIRWAF